MGGDDKDKKDKGKKDKDHKDKDKKDKDHKDKDKKDKDHKDKDKKDKDKKDKGDKDKDKKDKDKDKDKHKDPSHVAPGGFPQPGHGQFSSPPFVPPSFEANRAAAPGFPPVPPPFPAPSHGGAFPNAAPGFPAAAVAAAVPAPQPHTNTAAAPPSGYRVPLTTTSPFPDATVAGQPVCYDYDGVSPLFIGSALFENSVHPCKIGPHLQPFASVAFGGAERPHHGRFDLLPFIPQTMEWVRTSYGQIPPGRRPIEGGYEDNGAKLYHGLAVVNGVKVPGKTSEHLAACNVSFGGAEVPITDHEILCWR